MEDRSDALQSEADSDAADKWDAFAAGDYSEVVASGQAEAVEDDEWRFRTPLHHVADMFVHRFGDVAGRSSPAEFWWGSLVFVLMTAALLGGMFLHSAFRFAVLGWLLLAAIAWVSAAVRRLHDTDRGGSRLLLLLLAVPLANLYVLYLLTEGGDLRANSHGPPRVKQVGAVGKKMYRR